MLKLSGYGNFVKLLFTIVNVLLLLFGFVLFIVACVFKWSSTIGKLNEYTKVHKIVNVEPLQSGSTVILIVSVLLLIVGLLGLVSIRIMKRYLILLHEALLGSTAFVHLVIILVITLSLPGIETNFKNKLKQAIEFINSNETTTDDFHTSCNLTYSLSEKFECCGENGPSDFHINETYIVDLCCHSGQGDKGCYDRVFKSISGATLSALTVVSVIVLIIDVFSLIAAPVLNYFIKNASVYEKT